MTVPVGPPSLGYPRGDLAGERCGEWAVRVQDRSGDVPGGAEDAAGQLTLVHVLLNVHICHPELVSGSPKDVLGLRRSRIEPGMTRWGFRMTLHNDAAGIGPDIPLSEAEPEGWIIADREIELSLKEAEQCVLVLQNAINVTRRGNNG